MRVGGEGGGGGGLGRVGATTMMAFEPEDVVVEEARGMNVCVVNGWRSRTLTSKICWPLEVRRALGKQEKRLIDGLAGAPLGEVW